MLFKELRNRDAELSSTASAALSAIGGLNVIARLIRLIVATLRPALKLQALLALSNILGETLAEQRMVTLTNILESEIENEACRLAAVGGIALAGEHLDRRSRAYRHAVRQLASVIHSGSPAVRGFAVSALGQLRERRYIPVLQELARSDNAVCGCFPTRPANWTVGMEAADVILQLAGR